MRRLVSVGAVALLVLAACGDPIVVEPNADPVRPGGPVLQNGSCGTIDATVLRADLAALFVGGSPNQQSALGKFDNLTHQLNIGNLSEAKTRAWDIAEFVLRKSREGALIAPIAEIIRVINALFCYAGVDATVDTENAWIIFPTDQPQTLVNNEGWAGTQLPGNPVFEPSVLEIKRIDETSFPTGKGPLSTKLDQYPLFYEFELKNEGGTGLTNAAIVGLCRANGIPQDVFDRLTLGHDAANGFELPPPAPVDFLDCTNAPSYTPPSPSGVFGMLKRAGATLRDWVLPARLEAAPSFFFLSGLGGSATEFSPFGIVDPRLSTASGLGGSASEFAPQANPDVCPNGPFVEAPIGTEVPPECRPEVTVTTNLGTLLTGVPVTFTVLSGGGSVATEQSGGSCDAFGASSIVPTGADAKSRVCWTMGLTAGTNTVDARPGLGGDAVAGVVFSPSAFTFTATANAPSQLGFLDQPVDVTASHIVPLPPITVAVQDYNGVTVAVSSAAVTVALSTGNFAAGSVTTVNAVNGVATFSQLYVTTAATGLTIVASSPNLTSATSDPFDVGAAAATTMAKIEGDNQSVPAGTTVPIAPKVQVTDQYGNPVPGETVLFVPQNGIGSVTGGSQVTDASGYATVGSWTVQDDTNTLLVSLQANPLVFTTFTATGVTTLVTLDACDLGGSGDAVSYGFYIPGMNSKTIRQVGLYLSSNGAASSPTTYRLALKARLNNFSNTPVATSIVDVTLTGKNSQWLETHFRFDGTAGANSPITSTNRENVTFEIEVLSNPDGAQLSYNTGPCGLGNGCKPPKGCAVTQVESKTTLALRRKSVALTILGN